MEEKEDKRKLIFYAAGDNPDENFAALEKNERNEKVWDLTMKRTRKRERLYIYYFVSFFLSFFLLSGLGFFKFWLLIIRFVIM